MKVLAYRLLYVVAGFAVLGLLLRAVSTSVVSGIAERTDKPYRVSITDNGSPAYKIGALILRPIIEARIDRYISEQGLAEYLRDAASAASPEENFRLIDLEEGEGREVLCGQKVSAMILHFPMDSQEIVDPLQAARKISGSTQPVSFRLGAHEIKEINYALAGMRRGGSRIVTVTRDEEGKSDSYYVHLTSVDDKVPEAHDIRNLMSFDKRDTSIKEAATEARCGDAVSVKYTIKDVRGKVLVEDQVVDFIIGNRSVPIVLELGVVGLRSDSRRSIIAPPELLSGFDQTVDKRGVKIIDAQIKHKKVPTPDLGIE